YWIAPTFATLIAKIPFEFRIGYYFVPGGIYASAAVDKTLVPEQGTATATVTVTDQSGSPLANTTIFSGPFQNVTNALGQASFTFSASSGAVENLVVVSAPSGEIARAWYGIMASPPVLSYATPTVTANAAGTASTISVVVTNQVPVAGTTTVLLTVGAGRAHPGWRPRKEPSPPRKNSGRRIYSANGPGMRNPRSPFPFLSRHIWRLENVLISGTE